MRAFFGFVLLAWVTFWFAESPWLQDSLRAPFHDDVSFVAFEATIIALLIFSLIAKAAAWCRHSTGAIDANVVRGDQSWGYVTAVWGIASLFAVHIVNSTTAADDHKTAFHLLNLSIIFYLVFFDVWFRQLIISWAATARGR